jgi:hypothetical protein
VRRKDQNAMSTIQTGLDLDMLSRPVHLDLNLNDLRIIVGCFRAIAYQAKVDDEPYLDSDATDLSQRLEQQYRTRLEDPDGRNPE